MSAPVETKVKAASLAALVASFLVSLLVIKVPAIAGAADLLQTAVIAVVTSLGTWAGGWLASHTPRVNGQM